MKNYAELSVEETQNITGGGNFTDYMISYWKGLWKGLTS